MDNIFERDSNGEVISPNEPGYELLIDDIISRMEIAHELSTVNIRDQKCEHEPMGEMLGKPFPVSTTVSPA